MPRINIHITAENNELDQQVLSLDVAPDFSILDLKGYINAETNLPSSDLQFYLDGQPVVGDSKTLEQVGVKDGDMLAVLVQSNTQNHRPRPQQGQQGGRTSNANMHSPDQIETTRLGLLGNPRALAQARQQMPGLADAVQDPRRFRELYEQMMQGEQNRERERENYMRLLNEDPFNIEAQRKIEELIRQDRVIENLEYANEHNPEVFGRVTMLYINTEVNGHPIKAFVDSGAQTTIMSPSCAETCGIMRLVDKRFSGVARGVGTAVILGRVHSADIRIGNAVMPCSFTVMEGKDVDLLLGLDMLKRYQATIDLKGNKLVFENNEVDFLPESEIPKSFEEAQDQEPTLPGPNGTEIGTQSGTVKQSGSASKAPSDNNFRGSGHTLTTGPPTPAVQPTPGASSASAPQQPQQQARPSHPKESIDQLRGLGYSEAQVIAALDATGGNVEYAANRLVFGG